MMQRYRFVGSFTEIGDRMFSRVGQTADWDESFYREIVRGAPFIPDTDFQKIGFSSEELDRYADYGNRALATESFNSKLRQCSVVLRDVCEKLWSREVQEEIPPTSEVC